MFTLYIYVHYSLPNGEILACTGMSAQFYVLRHALVNMDSMAIFSWIADFVYLPPINLAYCHSLSDPKHQKKN